MRAGPSAVVGRRVPVAVTGYSTEMPMAGHRLDIVTVLAEDHAGARRLLEEVPGLSLEQRRAAFP
jgi:hypothetical protein